MDNDLVMLWHGRVIAEVPPGRMQSSDGKQGIAFNPAALDPDEFLGYINRAGGKTDSSAKPVEAPTATGEGSGAGVER
jgi:hypothetical protein